MRLSSWELQSSLPKVSASGSWLRSLHHFHRLSLKVRWKSPGSWGGGAVAPAPAFTCNSALVNWYGNDKQLMRSKKRTDKTEEWHWWLMQICCFWLTVGLICSFLIDKATNQHKWEGWRWRGDRGRGFQRDIRAKSWNRKSTRHILTFVKLTHTGWSFSETICPGRQPPEFNAEVHSAWKPVKGGRGWFQMCNIAVASMDVNMCRISLWRWYQEKGAEYKHKKQLLCCFALDWCRMMKVITFKASIITGLNEELTMEFIPCCLCERFTRWFIYRPICCHYTSLILSNLRQMRFGQDRSISVLLCIWPIFLETDVFKLCKYFRCKYSQCAKNIIFSSNLLD